MVSGATLVSYTEVLIYCSSCCQYWGRTDIPFTEQVHVVWEVNFTHTNKLISKFSHLEKEGSCIICNALVRSGPVVCPLFLNTCNIVCPITFGLLSSLPGVTFWFWTNSQTASVTTLHLFLCLTCRIYLETVLPCGAEQFEMTLDFVAALGSKTPGVMFLYVLVRRSPKLQPDGNFGSLTGILLRALCCCFPWSRGVGQHCVPEKTVMQFWNSASGKCWFKGWYQYLVTNEFFIFFICQRMHQLLSWRKEYLITVSWNFRTIAWWVGVF